ncbi:PiggyBac transposable element-derived protein 4 [Plakobranchus ocellatus]|uniref:PiggyBac transposable element-derived protein 4 n=1 Tax=Plakobranchus ocellatus TaxID=259542 RepID=A0AAV4DXB4_9GAST|nr:PiggyBac transposable element-derived protein 4 [Plakobranchus ocellatus]
MIVQMMWKVKNQKSFSPTTKGGVDSVEQMAHSFTVQRKTTKCLLVFFCNMVDIAERVVWSQAFPTNCFTHQDNRQLFLIQVAKQLAFDQVKRREAAAKTLNFQ